MQLPAIVGTLLLALLGTMKGGAGFDSLSFAADANRVSDRSALSDLVRFGMFSRSVSNPLAAHEFRAAGRALVFSGLLSVQKVPEPTSLALLGVGVLGIALLRRRRHT